MNTFDNSEYAEEHEVTAVGGTHAGAVFALNSDGEHVYIAAHLIDRDKAPIGTAFKAKMVPNFREQREKGNKWRAYWVEENMRPMPKPVRATPQPEPPKWNPPTDEEVIDFITQETVASTSDVIKKFEFGDGKECRNLLDKLHREEKIVRADVFVRATQVKASFTLWAIQTSDF